MDQAEQSHEETESGVEARQAYDVFISYSRDDIEFAKTLGKALRRFRPPKGLGASRHHMRVFRDETDLVGTNYPETIAEFLKRSRKLLLICSPTARGSQYVCDEIAKFAKSRDSKDIVPILYKGRPNGEYEPGQTDDRAFPAVLEELLQEPLAVDYRGFESAKDKPNQSDFRNPWYTLLANLYDVGRNDIERRDFRRQRRDRIIIGSVVGVVLASLATFGTIAWIQKLRADEQRNLALTGLAVNLAAKSRDLNNSRPDMSALVAVEAATITNAARRTPVPEARQALRDALSALAGRRLPEPPDKVATAGFDRDMEYVYAVGVNEVRRWPIGQEPTVVDVDTVWSPEMKDGESAATTVSASGRWFAAITENATWTMDLHAQHPATAAAAGIKDDVLAAVISDDGRWLVVHTDSESLLILDLAKDRLWQTVIGQPDTPFTPALAVKQFGIGPGRSILHAATSDKKLRFWALGETIQPLETMPDFSPPLDKLSVARDSRLFVLNRYKEPVSAYEFSDGGATEVKLLGELPSTKNVRFSPDGHWLFAATDAGETMLWDTGDLTADPIVLDTGLPSLFSSPTFSPNSRRVAATSRDDVIRVWNMERPRRRPEEYTQTGGGIKHLQFSPDSKLLVWINRRGAVGVIDLEKDEETAALTFQYPSQIEDTYISANSRWILTTSRDALWLTSLEDPFAGFRTVRRARSEPELTMERSRSGPGIDSLTSMSGTPAAGLPSAGAFSDKGDWFATISERGDVLLLHRLDRLSVPRTMRGIENATAVAFDPTGEWLVAGGQSEYLLAWNTLQPNSPPLRLSRPQSGGESTVAKLLFSPDGHWLGAGAAFGEAALWDWSAAANMSSNRGDDSNIDATAISLAGHEGWVLSIDFSLDSALMVTSGDRAAQVWTLEALGAPIARFENPLGYSHARLIPNQHALVTGGSDGVARIWSLDDPDAKPIELRGHEDSIINLALEARGNQLATISEDGKVLLWQLGAEHTAAMRELPVRHANTVAFISPEALVSAGYGPTQLWNLADLSEPAITLRGSGTPSTWTGVGSNAISTLAHDGTATIWPLGNAQLIDIACDRADTNLEYSLWRSAFADKPYEKTCQDLPVHGSVVIAGRELAERGDVDKAITLLTRAVALDPQIGIDPEREARRIAVEAMLERGKRLARDRKILAATVQFEQAKTLDVDAVSDPVVLANKLAAGQVHLQEGKKMAKRGRFEGAVAKYITARGVDPEIDLDPVAEALKDAMPVYLQRARDAARAGKLERAIEIYREVLAKDPSRTFDPTTEANRHAAQGHQSSAQTLAKDGQIAKAIEEFEIAMQLDPSLNVDPLSEARRLGAPVMARRAIDDLKAGRVNEGLERLHDAMQANPEMDITAQCWNLVCWHGALWNRADIVEASCDKAVALEPLNDGFRDSRGVARALQGDLHGAIADFEAYIATAPNTGRDAQRIESRRQWVAGLKNGRNPITVAELSRLREAELNRAWLGRCTK